MIFPACQTWCEKEETSLSLINDDKLAVCTTHYHLFFSMCCHLFGTLTCYKQVCDVLVVQSLTFALFLMCKWKSWTLAQTKFQRVDY